MAELEADDNSHHQLYRLFGVEDAEALLIERHQNTGRLLWSQLGGFMQDVVTACFRTRFPDAAPASVTVPGRRRGYQIDLVVGRDAYEIKWRDGSTDGDHDNKERARLEAIFGAGFRPIKLMFYLPLRRQARAIQERLMALYMDRGGTFYVEDAAWRHVYDRTGVDLGAILTRLAEGSEP